MRGGDALAQSSLSFRRRLSGLLQVWKKADLPWFFVSSVTNSRGKPLIGRKELTDEGYESSVRHREMVVMASSFETNTCTLFSLKDPRKHMSVIKFSPTGSLISSTFFVPSSCTMKYGEKSLRRQLRRNSPRAFISSDPFANLQKIAPVFVGIVSG